MGRDLIAVAREFGASARGAKIRALAALTERAARRGPGAAGVDGVDAEVAAAVAFVRAYPDDAAVRAAADELAGLLPAPPRVHPFSCDVVRRLAALHPGALTIAWDDVEDEARVQELLMLLLLPAESLGLEDIYISFPEWFRRAQADEGRTDVELILALLERSGWPPALQVHAYEALALPVRFDGPSHAALGALPPRLHTQRRPLERTRTSLRRAIRRPLPPVRRVSAARGRELLDLALHALCARDLEIYPLTYARADDVLHVPAGRGLSFVIAGVAPERRSALETLVFFLVLKNGVPIAYGPAAVAAGCCEMGINLFPEFRGGEIRYLYGQFMRVLHGTLGVQRFRLTAYGMGAGNDDALRSGAFWFYRKLGFRAADPDVEALARAEEARMRADPTHRSNLRMLRRLALTDADLDLSAGRVPLLPLAEIGLALSRSIDARFGGDRARCERAARRRVGAILDVPRAAIGLRLVAPLLAMIPDLHAWSRRDLGGVRRFVLAKGARSERRAAVVLAGHDRLCRALAALAELHPAGPSQP